MALQTSGPISLLDIQNEFGGSNPISLSEYYGAASGIPTSGAISIGNFYGATAFNPLSWTKSNESYFNTNINMDTGGLILSPYMKVFTGYNPDYNTTQKIDFNITPGVAVNFVIRVGYTGYASDTYKIYADGVLIAETNGLVGYFPSFGPGTTTSSPIFCSVLSVRLFNGSGADPYLEQSYVSYQMFSLSNVNLSQETYFQGCAPAVGAYYSVTSDNRFQDSTVASTDYNFISPSNIRIAGYTSSEAVYDVARWYVNGGLVSTTSGEQGFDIYRSNATSVGYTYTKDGSVSEGGDTTSASVYFRGVS